MMGLMRAAWNSMFVLDDICFFGTLTSELVCPGGMKMSKVILTGDRPTGRRAHYVGSPASCGVAEFGEYDEVFYYDRRCTGF